MNEFSKPEMPKMDVVYFYGILDMIFIFFIKNRFSLPNVSEIGQIQKFLCTSEFSVLYRK